MHDRDNDYSLEYADRHRSLLRRVSALFMPWATRRSQADARVVVRLERIRQESL